MEQRQIDLITFQICLQATTTITTLRETTTTKAITIEKCTRNGISENHKHSATATRSYAAAAANAGFDGDGDDAYAERRPVFARAFYVWSHTLAHTYVHTCVCTCASLQRRGRISVCVCDCCVLCNVAECAYVAI